MNLSDLIGQKVHVWILNQSQESLTPGTKFEGTFRGVDQGAYILEPSNPDFGKIVVLPIGSCRLMFV